MTEIPNPLWDLLNSANFENKSEEEILDVASKLIEDEFYDYFIQEERSRNASAPAEFPITYRIVATVIHALIFCLGLCGNLLLVVATYRSKRLRTPTYYYLLSLSCADLVVITTAIPEAIIGHHMGKQWLLGSVECSLFIFLNFVGINAGSASILTFTIERYIAVCRPLLAFRVCTLQRTRAIIGMSWILVVFYCAPWLALTEVRADEKHPERKQCHFRMSRYYYQPLFLVDFLFFYVLPFAAALIVYVKIALVLKQRRRPSEDCQINSRASLRVRRHVPGATKMNGFDRESSGFRVPDTAAKVPLVM